MTEAIIDGTRRNLIMNRGNSSGYYGITYRSFQSRSRPYCAMVRGKHLGAFATAVEGAIAVWRYVDEQQLEPHVLLSSEPLGPCPISASAKRKRGKGCGGFQRRGHPTCQDGPIGDDGRPKWIKGVLFCGESACRAAAGVVNSQTRATDLARKRPRDPEAPIITLPNLKRDFHAVSKIRVVSHGATTVAGHASGLYCQHCRRPFIVNRATALALACGCDGPCDLPFFALSATIYAASILTAVHPTVLAATAYTATALTALASPALAATALTAVHFELWLCSAPDTSPTGAR